MTRTELNAMILDARAAKCAAERVLEACYVEIKRLDEAEATARKQLVPPRAAGATRLTLVQFGPDKIRVIKVLREFANLGLKAAVDLVNNIPAIVSEGAVVDGQHVYRYLGAYNDPESPDYCDDYEYAYVHQWRVADPAALAAALVAEGATVAWREAP